MKPLNHYVLLPVLLFTLLLSGCSCGRLSEEEKSLRQVDREMVRLVDAFRSLGVYYRAEQLKEPMLKLYTELATFKDRLTDPAQKVRADKHVLHLKTFLGLLAFDAFYEGEVRIKDTEGNDVGLFDLRRVSEGSFAGLSFLPFEGEYLRASDIVRFYKELMAADPAFSFSRSALAMFLLSVRQFDDAIRLSDEALALNENDFFALRTLLVALSHTGARAGEVPGLAERFKKLTPSEAVVDYLLSQVAQEKGDTEEAIRLAEKAIGRVRSPAMIIHLARLYESTGDLKRARDQYAALLVMGKIAGERFYKLAEAEVERLKSLMKE